MRKITDFIVEKRNYILALFIILSFVCIFLSSKVNINYDLTRYLPEDSATKIGVDIMNDEFSGSESSSLNIMFKDLKDDEKYDIKEYLTKIPNVTEVLYDDTSSYNKDEYTLYKLTVDAAQDSKIASDVYKNIKDKYEDYEISTSGGVSTYNAPVLSIWVVALAIASAMVILIIMCGSYVEPFLFLFVIGLAVFLNKGTNIFFLNVSNITDSICAILQMALSMDYSIMLMNRYRQEKEHEKDNKKAMKEALYHSFLSISSSSITTIVGLLALVFMSFTIGLDLGVILAKGVIFSLISIFFVLPALILIFDKLIEKTSKKHFNVSLDFLGKFSYFIRRASILIFIVIFAVSFVLKDNLEYEFTGNENDKVKQVFEEDNQLALIYNNKDEAFFADYCKKITGDKRFTNVLCYANTISDRLKYNELNDKFSELGVSVSLDEDLIKVLYYNYYNEDDSIKMSYNEFISFVSNNVLNNPSYSQSIDNSLKNNINKLSYFTSNAQINAKRNYTNMASILGIPSDSVKNLYVLYNSVNPKVSMSLSEFYNFLVNNILTNSAYANMLSEDNVNSLNMMALYLDNNKNNTKLDASSMANLFNIDLNAVNNIYKYYNALGEPKESLTLNEFAVFTLNNVVTNPEYSASFDADTINKLNMIKMLSDSNITSQKMDASSLSYALNISEATVNMVMGLYNNVNNTFEYTMDIETFVKFILAYKDNDLVKLYLDNDMLSSLNLANGIIISSKEGVRYDYKDISKLLGIDAKKIYTLYHLTYNYDSSLTPREFVSFIVNTDVISSSLDSNALEKLKLVSIIMESVYNNKTFNYKEISSLTGASEDSLKLMYSLYEVGSNPNNVNYSLNEFVNFILKNVVTNPNYSSMFNKESVTKLNAINKVMASSLNNKKYSSSDLTANLVPLAGNIDSTKISLVYLLYGSMNNYDNDYALSIEELISYLNDDILNDSRFSSFIEDDMRDTIKSSNSMVNSSKDLLVAKNYSRIVLNSNLDPESEEIFNFIHDTNEDIKDYDAYLAGDSAMAYEMSESFDNELNLITILTMAFIFVVVAISFKSLLIPFILVLLIECAVFITMDILSFEGDKVYFIAMLIVQSILMGATIDYAILYTSYYLENRKIMDKKEALISSYNKSIHTILTSASILIIVTLIVGNFASAIAAKICITISKGTLCSGLLILLILPSLLAAFDKFIIKKDKA